MPSYVPLLVINSNVLSILLVLSIPLLLSIMSSSEANRRFETAIKDLQAVLNSADATAFKSTTAEDVWRAAEDIQAAQRKRKTLRAMNRIKPFLTALEGYSDVIAVVCNGTPFVPWIWVRFTTFD